MNTQTSELETLQFLEDQAFLKEKGIVFGRDSHSVRLLAGELSRRGWRWQFDPEHAEATKVLPLTGTEPHRINADDSDTVANLAHVVAEAIRFDEARGLRPTRSYRADVVIHSPDGEIVALVEVKNREGLTRNIATTSRRNLLVHGLRSQNAPYFLLTSQETGYLWDQQMGLHAEESPTTSFSMRPVIERYVPWLMPGERLGEPQLQLIVVEWLSDLTEPSTILTGSPEEILEQSGFLARIRHANVRSEPLV